MKVINALLDKDIQANIPQEFAYAPINPKAFATGRIPEAKAKFLPSYPPNASTHAADGRGLVGGQPGGGRREMAPHAPELRHVAGAARSTT